MLDRREDRLEPVGAARGAQHEIDVGMRGDGDEAVAAGARDRHAVHPGGRGPRSQRHPAPPKTIDRLAGRHRRDARRVPCDLRREEIRVLAGGEADDLQAIRVGVDDRERALADRAGRPEDRDALHRTYFSTT